MKISENNHEEMESLIVRFLEGKTTYEEEKQLQEWILSNPQNEAVFQNLRNIWITSGSKTKTDSFNSAQAWNSIDKKITSNSLPKRVRKISQNFTRIAAVFIIAFTLGSIITYLISNDTKSPGSEICEITTPLGSKTHMVLPDGTQVWLNAGSKLTYPQTFDKKERRVTLSGEAYFKVKTNKQKPFIVNTGFMDVKALGTTFNVKAYPDDKTITTTLVEGIVKIEGKRGKNDFTYTLKPNQNFTLRKEAITEANTKTNTNTTANKITVSSSNKSQVQLTKEVKTELYTSWKDARWSIEGESLNSLAILLERRFNVKIHVENTELNNYKFTGIIQNETFEQVLQFLSYTTPLEYEIGKGEVWWTINRKKEAQYGKILNKP